MQAFLVMLIALHAGQDGPSPFVPHDAPRDRTVIVAPPEVVKPPMPVPPVVIPPSPWAVVYVYVPYVVREPAERVVILERGERHGVYCRERFEVNLGVNPKCVNVPPFGGWGGRPERIERVEYVRYRD